MSTETAILCLEKRVRQLETALAVTQSEQKKLEEDLKKYMEENTRTNKEQSQVLEQLKRFMFLAMGVVMALQALGLIK